MEALTKLETCRVCANFYVTTSEVDFVDLFKAPEGLMEDMEFIQREIQSWQVQIMPDDELPQRICANCFTRFRSIKAFCFECKDAQQKLMQQYCCDLKSSLVETLHDGDVGSYLDAEAPVENEVVVGLEIIQDSAVSSQHMDNPNYVVLEEELPHFDPTSEYDIPTKDAVATVDSGTNMNSTLGNMPQEENEVFLYSEPMEEVEFACEVELDMNTQKVNSELHDIISQDVEEVLQGSIIPRKPREQLISVEEQPSDLSPNSDDADLSELDDADKYSNSYRLDGKAFACHYCYCPSNGPIDHLIFSNSDVLSRHYFDVHDPNQPYTCPYCPNIHSSAKARDYHLSKAHGIATQRPTPKCKFCCQNITGLISQHQFNCTYIDDWECLLCGKRFRQTTLGQFREHQQTHDNSVDFVCNICNRSFVRRVNLEAHKKAHTGDVQYIKCNECNLGFPDEGKLKKHKYQVHNGDMPNRCSFCGKGFVSVAFLKRHVEHLHLDKLDESHPNAISCNNCGTTFTSMYKLRFHLQRPRDENGKCIDWQGGREKRNQRLRGVLACPYCPRRFNIKGQFEKHCNKHNAELRPYQCDRCHIRCRTALELTQHVNVAHLKTNAYACELCGQCFGQKIDLQRHVVLYAETHHLCPEDDCTFMCSNESPELAYHLRTVHRADMKIELYDEQFVEIETSPAVEVWTNNSTQHITHSLDLNNYGNNTVFKPLPVPEANVRQYFMDSPMDPEQEIIVT